MITSWFATAVSKFLTGESVNKITYCGFGTGTTAATESNISLNTEIGTRSSVSTSVNDKLLTITSETNPADSDFYDETITESGTFDAITSGNMFDHYVTSNGVVLDNTNYLKITKRIFTDNNLPALDLLAKTVTSWFNGSASPPTHIAFGTNRILDRCDADTGWVAGDDADTETQNTTNFQEGTASLNLGKNGTSATTFYYEKTITSADLSSDDTFVIWLNINNQTDFAKLTSTDTVKIWLGNDSSNYYELSIDKADLYTGWIRIESSIWSDFTENGSVDDTDIDYLRITFTTNNTSDTIALGNILMDYWNTRKDITATDTDMVEEIGSRLSTTKSIDLAVCKFVAVLDASTNNGYKISEVAMYDASTNGNILIYDKSINILKSTDNQIRQEFRVETKLNN